MRFKKAQKNIRIDVNIHKKLKEDTKHFQKIIGGGRWSFSDTIEEYQKIIKQNG